MNEQHAALNAHLRRLSISELASNNYMHLRNPNKKPHLPSLEEHDFISEKFRLNYMLRPFNDLGCGDRNLNVGRIEIIIQYLGQIKDDDFRKGFVLNNDPNVRTITGFYLFKEINTPLYFYLNNPNISQLLVEGKYCEFVRKTMSIVDSTLDMFKDVYSRNGQIYVN